VQAGSRQCGDEIAWRGTGNRPQARRSRGAPSRVVERLRTAGFRRALKKSRRWLDPTRTGRTHLRHGRPVQLVEALPDCCRSTFVPAGRRRRDGWVRTRKMYRVPQTRPRRPAVGGPMVGEASHVREAGVCSLLEVVLPQQAALCHLLSKPPLALHTLHRFEIHSLARECLLQLLLV
jgi:hypothetical protein